MEVRWFQINPFVLVHHYKNFQDHLEQQRPEYRGRTEFLRDNITEGHVALRIHHIRPSDGGKYSCFFESSTYFNEAQFQVLVTGSGTAPHIRIDLGETKGLVLTCTSAGWYPEPEVEWRDLQGQRLLPASETKTPERSGLFHVETSITLDKSSAGNVACSIRNPVLKEEKEVHISVTGSLMKKHDKLTKELDRRRVLGKESLNKVQRFAEDIKLDATSAHPYLSVSDDGKCVTSLQQKQHVCDFPERFDTLVAVLGQKCFSGGRHYWEVGVAGKNKWKLGLCMDSVNRKGQYTRACPENGFWAISLKNGVYQALSTPRYSFNVPESLLIVGIFLNYEKGLIIFYNVTEFTTLYTFKSNFNQPLKPYFYPGPLSKENSGGLTLPSASNIFCQSSLEHT
ncbi:butyrophilin subfamily 1 member A1-like [Dasypus novemcinctus]|uniref:butyrophilin subfamily 1 member A1-like n=1 Tax=Dasypus novemcinctus TaxID=9361 RepID=UPI00265E3B61|nr:butyrophilin subfamily 1 member A1-like [Dasypus novemcinctus]